MRGVSHLKPSPAMAVACLALLVALGGTGVAAYQAVIPRNSVGTAQLRNGAVTSAKVKNRSLRAADFARGQIPPGPRGSTGPQGPAGPAGVAAPGYVAEVVSQTSTTASTTKSTSWVDLTGSSQSLTIPSGETGRLYIWFTAESACYGGTGVCGVRILVDNTEATPASGTDFAFDSTNGGTEKSTSWEGHAMIRQSDTLQAGSHTVKVQFRTSQAATTLALDDWALVIERTKAS